MKTCTALLLYEGDTGRAVYAAMRGPMIGRAFDAHRAEIVGTFEFKRGEPRLDYATMTAAHATAKAPAVYWQRG
jgi:hypothetical protein